MVSVWDSVAPCCEQTGRDSRTQLQLQVVAAAGGCSCAKHEIV